MPKACDVPPWFSRRQTATVQQFGDAAAVQPPHATSPESVQPHALGRRAHEKSCDARIWSSSRLRSHAK
ncbi:hypothetical protein GUJ93_ZPchr0002g25425 [Zizania palustris]|uniref:Uncharacterized protein n=1 Tax=Zizania palustris TaxID=103762 RepID=A0A8J5S5U2_ZIZPA|nr:hypothetical protein GUJ93_ZPchr0002g25425 [Zizania palustris]